MPIALLALRLRARRRRLVEGAGYLTIAASPLVMGTGLFILLFPVADPLALALPVTALVNALMALPFALRALVPALAATEARLRPAGRQPGPAGLRPAAAGLSCRGCAGRSGFAPGWRRRSRWAISG